MTTTRRLDLCKGYLTFCRVTQTETLYAVLPSGAVLQTNPLPLPNPHFDIRGQREWMSAPALPADAEFIGNYEIPSLT